MKTPHTATLRPLEKVIHCDCGRWSMKYHSYTDGLDQHQAHRREMVEKEIVHG